MLKYPHVCQKANITRPKAAITKSLANRQSSLITNQSGGLMMATQATIKPPILLAKRSPTPGVFTICTETSGNGATTTTAETITRKVMEKIHTAPRRGKSACCAAAVGPVPPKALAHPLVTVRLPDSPMCAWGTRHTDFGVSEKPLLGKHRHIAKIDKFTVVQIAHRVMSNKQLIRSTVR